MENDTAILDEFSKNRSQQMDIELTTISYRIEIKMFYVNYKNLPFSQLINQFKNNVTDYMSDAFQYRFIVSNIMCIISTWEQQLYRFCNQYIQDVENNYGTIRDKFLNKFGVDEYLFSDIDEYRYVDNVLKHGKRSESYKKLQNMNSNFLIENENFKSLDHTNFNLPILNICNNSIFDLCDKIEKFWLDIVAFATNKS